MHRLYSGGLLFALVFSTAHTPTIQLQRGAHPATESNLHASTLISTAAITGPAISYRAMTGDASPPDVWLAAALQRDFAEDDAIKRFMLDDFYLPTLDVSLPVLFDWSDQHHEYLAEHRWTDDLWPDTATFTYALDNLMAASFPTYGLLGATAGRGSQGFGGGMRGPSAADRPGVDAPPVGSATGDDADGSSNTPNTGDGSESEQETDTGGWDPGLLPPIYGGTPDLELPIEPTPTTVQVPAPGSLGLFALGLAGLCVANRRKKPKRLAAN